MNVTRRLALLALPIGLLVLGSMAAPASAQAPTDVFFSEYIEGTSFNKAIEIFNGTGTGVNLTTGAYVLELYSNGSATPSNSLNLTGVIASGDVLVGAHPSADALILAQADFTDANVINWNGDDAVVLRKGGAAGPVVDVIGQVGFDPGTEWGTGDASTADNTIRRKAIICQGDTNPTNAFDPAIEWDGFAVNTFGGLGAHTVNCTPGTPTPSPTPLPIPEFLAANTSFTLADPFDCTAAGDVLNAELVFVNSGQAVAGGVVLDAPLPIYLRGVAGSCQATGGLNGSCEIDDRALRWTGDVPFAPPNSVVAINFQVRVAGGTVMDTALCIDAALNYPRLGTGPNDTTLPIGVCATVDCLPTVDPNRQLGAQVHLPILNFQGQDDVCTSWIELQLLGCDPSKAVLITWAAPGFCPPQAAGPLKVECTGMLVPGSAWNLFDAQIPTGSKSGIVFKFSARQLSEVGLDLGFDDVVADLMCEELFFGVVGDADDYRRFKKAYNEGLEFRAIPQSLAIGDGFLAVEVLRRCPGDVTPGVNASSKYNGIAGTHLGTYDPVFGGFGYYVPLVYAEKAGLTSVMYIQNGGIECSSVEIWFKAQDDCLRSTICEIVALAPGESYQFDASDCVGPDWQGNAWLRSSEPLGVAVDIVGRDMLMTYVAEPQELNFAFDPDKAYATGGDRVAYGPLIYSEYQGWDSGLQVQNLNPVTAAKVKVYFLDRSGDVITTLVDWICPRGSQTFFLPVVNNLPGNWIGNVRVESQNWWTPGTKEVKAANIVAVAQLIKYSDAARTDALEAIAYELLPEHKAYDWQVGAGGGGLESGVGLIAVPSLLKDLEKRGVTTELAIANLVPKAGFTDLAIYFFDQNGLIDYVCQKLSDRQVEYIDLQTWGYFGPGFKGSAIISATFWEHEVFDNEGFFLRNVLGLGAVAIERTGTRLGEDIPGDEAAGSRAIPFTQHGLADTFAYCFAGPAAAFCPGQPGRRPTCPNQLVFEGQGGEIPDDRAGGEMFQANISVNFPSLPGQCVIEDVNLFLSIDHDETRDLDVFLDHAGLRPTMFGDICFDDEDILATLDDDDPAGNGPIGNDASCAGAGPAGQGDVYTTQSGTDLDVFDGQDPKGLWSLIVDDDFETTFGFGSVVEWKIILDIGESP